MQHRFSRTELYELVWSEPRSALAKRFGLSDVGLSKLCVGANIPQPPRGYWARLAAGKRVARPTLPPRSLGQADWVRIGHAHYAAAHDEDDPVPPTAPVFDESLDQLRARAAALVRKSRVPTNLSAPHRIVAAVLDDDLARRKALDTWPTPEFVGPEPMRRARLVNSLLVVLAHAGCNATLHGQDLRQFSIRVGDVILRFGIGEIPQRTQKAGPSMHQRREQEGLRLAADGRQPIPDVVAVWEDGHGRPLERRILEIAQDILVLGEMHYRAAALRDYGWHVECKNRRDAEAREQQERLAREIAERDARVERQRQHWLQRQAANMQKANQIRAFIDALDRRRAAEGMGDEADAYRQWRSWASSEADRLDPLLQPWTAVMQPPAFR